MLDQVSAHSPSLTAFQLIVEDFYWRIRLTPPSTRRFSLKPFMLNREVAVILSGRRLPSTIKAFRELVNSRCPSVEGRPFQLRCSVWLPDPYAIIPRRFSEDLPFGTGLEGDASDISKVENARYWRLINGCRKFAMEGQSTEVAFEVKVLFKKI